MVGSAVLSVVALLLKGLYGGGHLETLVHGVVILGSVGLVGCGLAGLALGADHPLGRYPVALILAIVTVVLGTLRILRIIEAAAPPCTPESCFRGFENTWIQVLLAFNIAFLALLFLVAAWRESRASRKHEQDDGRLGWLLALRSRRAVGLTGREDLLREIQGNSGQVRWQGPGIKW